MLLWDVLHLLPHSTNMPRSFDAGYYAAKEMNGSEAVEVAKELEEPRPDVSPQNKAVRTGYVPTGSQIQRTRGTP